MINLIRESEGLSNKEIKIFFLSLTVFDTLFMAEYAYKEEKTVLSAEVFRILKSDYRNLEEKLPNLKDIINKAIYNIKILTDEILKLDPYCIENCNPKRIEAIHYGLRTVTEKYHNFLLTLKFREK